MSLGCRPSAIILGSTFTLFWGIDHANAERVDLPPDRALNDTAYGRIDGDVFFRIASGVTVGPGAPRAALDLRARYFDMAGLFVTYEDAFSSTSSARRVVATGFELRPLFVARWVQGWHFGVPFTDLLLDSFGIELGVQWTQVGTAKIRSTPGFQFGIGLEAPLFGRATGLWLGVHGGLRWSNEALAQSTATSAFERASYFTFTLGWHQVVSAKIAGATALGR